MHKTVLVGFIISTVLFGCCKNLNILVVIPTSVNSHFFTYKSLFLHLAKINHNVTILSDYGNIMPSTPNLTNVQLSEHIVKPNSIPIDKFPDGRFQMYTDNIFINIISKMECSKLKKNKKLDDFFQNHQSFDIILMEIFGTNCYLGITRKYSVPVIGLSSTDLLPWMHQWFGSPENPSYIPVLFMDYADRLSFFQRVENTLMLVYSKLLHFYFIAPSGNEFSKKYLGIDLYEGGDIMYDINLLLVNRHFTYQTAKPLSPNVIEVGGIHLEKPKQLPKELDSFVRNSSLGTIFMSMGSVLQGSTFPEEKRKMFLKVFSQLKYNVIWKWENDSMEGLPENVKIHKWLPQLDLLCNPKVKLFITHGGLLGGQEAVHCGVPMLIIPQFADQHYNAAVLGRSGVSLTLKLKTSTERSLLEAINKVLKPEFFENAKALSERFKDRPMSPMDTAIYWIEYVARHKGAPFMKTAVTDMPFYQYLLLDVVAFLIILLAAVLYTFYKSLRVAIRTYSYFLTSPKVKTA